MFKFNSCNKENKNLSNVLLSQDTLRKKYFSQRSNKKSSAVTKINLRLKNKFYSGTRFFSKQDESYLNFKKTLFLRGSKQVKEDSILVKQSNLKYSLCQDENKVKLRNGKLKVYKRNPLAEANTDCHRNILIEANSNFTPQKLESHTSQAPLKTPQKFKLNPSDLRLKSPLVKKSLVCNLKNNGPLSNVNSIHSPYSGNDKSFAFLEGRLNKFHSIKKNTVSIADREAFDVFSFPIKNCVGKHNPSDMGSMKNSASVHGEKNSSMHSSSLVSKPPTKGMNIKSATEEANSNVGKSNMLESKIMSQYSFQTKNSNENIEGKISCVDETQFASPVLGSMILAVGSDSNAASPVLDSKKNKTSKLQADVFVQSRECSLSPILNISEGHKKRIHYLKMKSLHCNVTDEKPNVYIVENERDNCHDYFLPGKKVGSPVLDSSQRKKDIFLLKFKTASCKSYLKPKLDEEEISPSPVLDASQFKKPIGKFKNISVGENCINSTFQEVIPRVSYLRQNNDSSKVSCGTSHKEIQTQEHSFKSNKELEEESSLKEFEHKEKINCGVSRNSLVRLSNEGCFIESSKLNPLEEISEPLSQVLDSNKAKNIWSEGINAMESKLKSTQKPVCLAVVSEATIFHPQSTIKFKDTVSGLIGNEMNYRQHVERFPVFSSCDELMESCSPVLDSSKFKRNFSEKQTETQTSKSQESWSKVSPKRTHSPITDSNLKFKKLKTELYIEEMDHRGPMLGLVSESPVSDNGLCPNISNLDQDEILVCSPSFNSELDIRKFPIMLPNSPIQCSPKERSEKLLTDENCDIVMSSQIYPNNFEGRCHSNRLLLKNSCQDKMESNFYDKSKLLSANSNLIAESTMNPVSHNPELMSPILSRSEACKNAKFSPGTDKNNIKIFPILKKGETNGQNQFTKNYSIPSKFSGGQETDKRHVKKNLSLYYEEVKPETSSMNDKFSKQSSSENVIRPHTKDKKRLDDEKVACESQISGVGKLQTLPCEYADSDEILVTCEHQNNKGHKSLLLENNSSNHKWLKPLEPSSSNKSVPGPNPGKNVNTESKQKSHWKNQLYLFDDNEEICIEDFDEESPLDKENVDVIVDANKLDSVKQNLNHKFEQSPSCTDIMKQVVPEAKSLLLNFELDDQSKNTCEYMSSEESSCEVEIQEDFSQKTSETSPAFRIEYSTTPTVKSSEGTQNEAGSNPPSFPPALEVEANISPSAGVLDSACKNRRARVKRGSAVERLRRLVRGQHAEVNMFHHEASAPTRARARACSLCVTSATQTCSLLILNCRYMDAQRTMSQGFTSGEEVVDPEVHVYVDPSHTKNIAAGCVVTVFPPWHSVWHESRGVVVMYCVTKLQLEIHNQSLPRNGISLTSRSNAACTTQVEFGCQFQDEHCGCRSQLVGQLFTAPPQPQGAVLPAGGADGAITTALAGGWFPHRVKLILTILHCFKARSRHNQVQPGLLCVDASGHICQLNLRSEQDVLKLGPLKEAHYKTFVVKNLTVCKRIFIDKCNGLRSFLTHLYADSANQQLLYVATPSSDEWTAQLIDETAASHISADIHSRIICHHQQLLSLPINEEEEGRVRARVRVMAVRRDELFAWDPQLDSYFKLNITSSAVVPNCPARACLDLLYLWAHHGELTIDKFTEVSIVEAEGGNSPTIPPLAIDSTEENLVLLDSVVTKVSSEAYLRWEGNCGHKVLRVQKTGLYFCVTCRQTSASCTQKVVLEVCVAAVDIPHPIRVKVKSETARVLLADTSGQISSDKSYNVIGVIGSTLKCLAVVTEVLRNSFGDIIEFVLEEL